jgi:hypothetical protein
MNKSKIFSCHDFTVKFLFSFKAGKELARYRIMYIGATIRQCKTHIVKHQNEFIRQTIGSFDNEDERKEFLQSLSKSLDLN